MSADVQNKPGDTANGHMLSDDGTRWIPVADLADQAGEAEAGERQGNWFARHKVLTGVIGAGALLLAIGAIGSGGEFTQTDAPATAAAVARSRCGGSPASLVSARPRHLG